MMTAAETGAGIKTLKTVSVAAMTAADPILTAEAVEGSLLLLGLAVFNSLVRFEVGGLDWEAQYQNIPRQMFVGWFDLPLRSDRLDQELALEI